ncbi:asparagine synthase B [Nocardia brasiliensis]|uniref:asparagine synthase B n=1 Tax=Nocardia brasiliensis TaxID=37326 RepID=UPI00366F19CD
MCGIVAIHGNPDSAMGRRMLARLAHRGPDGTGELRCGNSWLGHQRLAIVDVRHGGQPLVGRGYGLIVNGEIYNHLSLRNDFAATFATGSDSEVVLHLYAEFGTTRFQDLEGMFAFAIAGPGGAFCAARDRVGIKPLYWATTADAVIFASELKAFDAEVRALVRPFPPGHYWTPEQGLVRYAAIPDAAPSDVAEEGYYIQRTADVLTRSTEKQMMGDVPVGVLLSGGLDSSIVAAIAARWCSARGTRLQTFAVGLEGSPDLTAARTVAEYLDTDHHESSFTAADVIAAVPKVITAVEQYDPALIHSSVANFLLAEYVARHVKVVLTGEGADELFAGYRYMRAMSTPDELHTELVRSVTTLHSLNLQRCDRTTMAHGLEARVPFLETEMIELGLSIPAAMKLTSDGQTEKRLLRRAFAPWLPPSIAWRKKEQFGDGSGVSTILRRASPTLIDDREFAARDREAPTMRNKEEYAYYKLWAQQFGGVNSAATLDFSMTT